MAITRTVITEVYCDACGKEIIRWSSTRNGVSKAWAEYFAREQGHTVGKQVVCKECRIKKRMDKCSLRKGYGISGTNESGLCSGIINEVNGGFIEQCKHCIARETTNED